MKNKLPQFRKGDVLVRTKIRKAPDGTLIASVTDQITLLEDNNPEEAARVRPPSENTLLVRVEYIGDREMVNHRWIIPVKHGLMDNYHLSHNYELKGGQPSLI